MVRRIRFIYGKSILGFPEKFGIYRYCTGMFWKGHQWGPHSWEAYMGPRWSVLACIGQVHCTSLHGPGALY